MLWENGIRQTACATGIKATECDSQTCIASQKKSRAAAVLYSLA